MNIFDDLLIIDSCFIVPPPEKNRHGVIYIQAIDIKSFGDLLRQRGTDINRIIKGSL